MSYLEVNAPFFLFALAVLVIAVVIRKISWRTAIIEVFFTALVLCILTAIFDNLMIYVGLFEYADEALVGAHIGLAPVEDFAYPLVAAILLPGLRWLLMPPRVAVTRSDVQSSA